MNDTLLLFDIDGTLLTSGHCGKNAFDRTFEKMFGVRGAWGDMLPDGKTDLLIGNEIARRHLGRELTLPEWADFTQRYTKHFAEESEHSIHFRTMPGAFKLLEYLSDIPHIHLAVATGNIEAVSWIKLKKVRLHSYFRCGGFGENHAHRMGILSDAHQASQNHFKKKFSKRKIFVIGDTRHDIDAAHKMRFRSIGVKTGTNRGDDFKIVKPHHLLDDFSDLDRFLLILSRRFLF